MLPHPKVGIAVTAFDNLPLLQRCIASIRQFTPSEDYDLVVAVDGEPSEILEWLKNERIAHASSRRGGAAKTKNLALSYWSEHGNWPRLILIEDDVNPVASDWLEKWSDAVNKWGHVGWAEGDSVFGCVCAMTRSFFETIGFFDQRFYAASPTEGWAYEDMDWMDRVERLQGRRVGMNYGLVHGTMPEKVWRSNKRGLARNIAVYEQIKSEPIYRFATV